MDDTTSSESTDGDILAVGIKKTGVIDDEVDQTTRGHTALPGKA